MGDTAVVRQYSNNGTSISVYRQDGSESSIYMDSYVSATDWIPLEGDNVDLGVLFNISKAKEEEGLVSGWASVAVNKDGSLPLDWQDDIVSAETLEKAAVSFMLNYQGSGEMHKGDSVGTVVESIVFTKEKQAAIGIPEGTIPEGWFITVKLHDTAAIEKVKDGTYKMFSIQGKAKRIKL